MIELLTELWIQWIIVLNYLLLNPVIIAGLVIVVCGSFLVHFLYKVADNGLH